MNNSKALSKLPADTELNVSIERWTRATTDQTETEPISLPLWQTYAFKNFWQTYTFKIF